MEFMQGGRSLSYSSDSEDNTSVVPAAVNDEYNIAGRFWAKHGRQFESAYLEIKRDGHKQSCWSWYMLPVAPWVVNGVERGSSTNQFYCLRDHPPNNLRGDDAARAYLRLPPSPSGVDLRDNYLRLIKAVNEKLETGISSVSLVGFLDDPKMRSSIRLFERVSRDGFDPEIHEVCLRAMELLKEKPDGAPGAGEDKKLKSSKGNKLSSSNGTGSKRAANNSLSSSAGSGAAAKFTNFLFRGKSADRAVTPDADDEDEDAAEDSSSDSDQPQKP